MKQLVFLGPGSLLGFPLQSGRRQVTLRPMICTLCDTSISDPFFHDVKRQWVYWECPQCELVFRDPETYLEPSLEKARYETHNNTIEDPRYVKFLSPALEGVKKYVPSGRLGLDYGCGPGPTLSEMIRRQGYSCEDYDPLFFANKNLLEKKYDFVTCTEIVEHFYRPGFELDRIDSLLKPEAVVVFMTDHRSPEREFSNWGYRTDITHVCFFNETSWEYVSRRLGWELLEYKPRFAAFRKRT